MRRRVAFAVVILLLLPYLSFLYVLFSAPSSGLSRLSSPPQVLSCPTNPAKLLNVEKGKTGSFQSISEAVSAANTGDMIIIHEGMYTENVAVDTSCLKVAGTTRDRVILDGGFKLGNGISVTNAPGVSISNMTVRNYLGNGVIMVQSNNWEMKNLVSRNNGIYGLYALSSRNGRIVNSVASGSGDSGLYIGEVDNCNCLIENSTAYGNTLGYSGTRANGVVIRDSRFFNNSLGIAPSTLLPDIPTWLTGRWKLPLFGTNHTIINNVVENNNNRTVRGVGLFQQYGVPIGTGIALIGSYGNRVDQNQVSGNARWGIAEWYFFGAPINNVYTSNRFARNGQDFWSDGSGLGGCSGNEVATGDVPLPCSIPWFLRLSVPNPIKEVELILSLERPGPTNAGSQGIPGYTVSVFGLILLLAATSATGVEGAARRGRRIITILIDLLFAGDLLLALLSIFVLTSFRVSGLFDLVNGVFSLGLLLAPLAYFLLITVWFFYGLVSEAIRGRTLGAWVLSMRLATKTGARPSLKRVAVRNLLRYIDSLAFGLVGLVSLVIKGRTFGEIISGAHVMHES